MTAFLGCLIPATDHVCAKYFERQWKSKTTDQNHAQLWERAEWSMPMRYIGGVIGFVWAASVYGPLYPN